MVCAQDCAQEMFEKLVFDTVLANNFANNNLVHAFFTTNKKPLKSSLHFFASPPHHFFNVKYHDHVHSSIVCLADIHDDRLFDRLFDAS